MPFIYEPRIAFTKNEARGVKKTLEHAHVTGWLRQLIKKVSAYI